MKQVIYFLVLLLLTGSCIDPLNVNNHGSTDSMVVYGLITDQPGPYTINLYRTAAIDSTLSEQPRITGAILTIRDDQGISETLKEVSAGTYQTSSTQGVVGRTYTLYITTKEGATYQSNPETLLPVGDITALHSTFVQAEAVDIVSIDDNTTNGFHITLDGNVLTEQSGNVRWRWTGTFETEAYPKYKIAYVTDNITGQFTKENAPPPCSGWIYATVYSEDGSFPPYHQLQQKGPCTCCFCWNNEVSTIPLLSDKRLIVNGAVSSIPIAFISASENHLFTKYYLEVEQLSCSPEVYNFWKRINTQELQGSDLFQTAPAATGGNISATSLGAPSVIGVFSASSIKTKSITLTRADVPYGIPLPDSLFDACTVLYGTANSTTVQPPFW